LPWRFLSQLDFRGAVREFSRNVANWLQLRMSRRVSAVGRIASHIFAANCEVQAALDDVRGIRATRLLETGIEQIETFTRKQKPVDRLLRILWAGRLESWKGLPLLLRALAQVQDKVDFRLRIVGAGRSERRWKRLAQRLGLDDRLEWVGWPKYTARLPHYQWADVFAFTSLRDTSGTGLLESLASGVPIIGLDHQGARDVMTEQCAIAIPVESPRQVIEGFGAAIEQLAADPVLLEKKSAAALRRAEDFLWEDSASRILGVYAEAVAGAQPSTAMTAVRNELVGPAIGWDLQR
jgi:glycosyltransferase involved in cell wall biosynthesis